MTDTISAEALLRQLVDRAGQVAVCTWEPFVAVRIGVREVVVFHPRAEPIRGASMALIDELGHQGLLDVARQPSGARLLQVTDAGLAAARGASGAPAAAD